MKSAWALSLAVMLSVSGAEAQPDEPHLLFVQNEKPKHLSPSTDQTPATRPSSQSSQGRVLRGLQTNPDLPPAANSSSMFSPPPARSFSNPQAIHPGTPPAAPDAGFTATGTVPDARQTLCVTTIGACGLAVSVVSGLDCWCRSTAGPVFGKTFNKIQ